MTSQDGKLKAVPPDTITLDYDPDAGFAVTMTAEFRSEPFSGISYTRTSTVEGLAEALQGLQWMASVIYLHYHNRTDLDPIQQKHLELAIRNGVAV